MQWDGDRNSGWLRLWFRGPGIHWTNREPLFSERIGIRKPFLRLLGLRFFPLRNWRP